jgi:hypothetical protein
MVHLLNGLALLFETFCKMRDTARDVLVGKEFGRFLGMKSRFGRFA